MSRTASAPLIGLAAWLLAIGAPASLEAASESELQSAVFRAKPAVVMIAVRIGATATVRCGSGATVTIRPGAIGELGSGSIIHPDGSALTRITPHGNFCGSPKWMADSKHVIAYCTTGEQTLEDRRPFPDHPEDSRIIVVDISTKASIRWFSTSIQFWPCFTSVL